MTSKYQLRKRSVEQLELVSVRDGVVVTRDEVFAMQGVLVVLLKNLMQNYTPGQDPGVGYGLVTVFTGSWLVGGDVSF